MPFIIRKRKEKRSEPLHQNIPRQGSMLPLEGSASFTFTVMLLKMGKLSLEPINTTASILP